MSKTNVVAAFVYLIINCLLIQSSFAKEFGLKAGFYMPSGMTVEGSRATDFETSTALTLGVDYDIKLASIFAVRPTLDLTSFANGADDAVQLADLGIDFVYFATISDYDIRPSMGIAYGLGTLEIYDENPTGSWVTEEFNEFLVYRIGVEINLDAVMVDVGLRGYEGGNEEDVWIHPGLVVRVGKRF